MDFIAQIIKVFMRIFLGESRDEKDFRIALEQATRYYSNGNRYNSPKDFHQCLLSLQKAPDAGALNDMQLFKRHQMGAGAYIKTCTALISGYKGEIEKIDSLAQAVLANYTDAELKNISSTLTFDRKKFRDELQQLMGNTMQRNDDEKINFLKTEITRVETEQADVQDKLFVMGNSRNKKSEYRLHLVGQLETQTEGALREISAMRELRNVPKEEVRAIEKKTHSYFDHVKSIQVTITEIQHEEAEEAAGGGA